MTEPANRPLFDAFPALRGRVPFVPLAELPTPLARMERLSARVGADVWIKRDGLTHSVYGGNKIRKFEFVFGDVLHREARAVLTGGGLGSHHTLATAVIARQFGLQAVCSYYCQPLDEEVYRNLRLSAALGIDAHFCGDYLGLAVSFLGQYLRWLVRTRRSPYFIYPGAPGTLGTLGYVNAAFEIKAQLEATATPEPEVVFVAVGSCGTFAGLILGARLAGLGSRIVGVRIIEEDVANRPKIARMVNRAARYLRRRDPSVPSVEIEAWDVDLLDGYLGAGYAHATEEARQAVALTAQAAGLPLETTYTGKAMAALLDYAGRCPGSRILFIDTFAESPALEEGDYRDLPKRFWPLFDPTQQGRCWCLRAWRNPGFCHKHSVRPGFGETDNPERAG
jgi:1-aminocyclopropane-1-carboxylate deaminase/D-cysteine desulfhydrase-like pyridoxal-dependent ACC family enzyme